jgi:hypothetical protein
LIRKIAHDDVVDLLHHVRGSCPNAVIFYFGFFPGLSYESRTSKIREFFKHEYGDDVAWWFNEHVYQVEDIDRLIQEGQTRALWLNGRWQYWTRRAVADVNEDDAVRGRGLVYVPSGFRTVNSALAPTPFLWELDRPASQHRRLGRTAHLPRRRHLALPDPTRCADLSGSSAGDSVAEQPPHQLGKPLVVLKCQILGQSPRRTAPSRRVSASERMRFGATTS